MRFGLTNLVNPWHSAVGASFNTFTTRADVSPEPKPLIQGGVLELGSRLWIKAVGEFSTTGTPTLVLGFFIGTQAVPSTITTDIAVSSAITTGSGAAAWSWDLEWFGICTALGTSGSLVGSGTLQLGTSLTALSATPIPITQALRTCTIDTTIARAIGVSAAWSASSASNNVKCNTLGIHLD